MIARVFPRRTSATPDDELAFVGDPPANVHDLGITQVLISVVFTWDKPEAERLYWMWSKVAMTLVGGPAYGSPALDFMPGRFTKQGIVITSRGCPNNCWFCRVPKLEGKPRILPVRTGHNVFDSNLLSMPLQHRFEVYSMLVQQPNKVEFTGGLEAKRLTPHDARCLALLKPKSMWFAYDTSDDYEPLVEAGKLLLAEGVKPNDRQRCYVLCGFKNDTFEKAEKRFRQAWDASFIPFAMLYRDETGQVDETWRKFQREWANPWIVCSKLRKK